MVFSRANLSPNHVTSLALFSGMVCGFWMSLGSRFGLLMGVLFLHLSFILDNCDGELARIRSLQTGLGKWYDIVSDLLVEQFLWIGLAVGSLARGVNAPVLWVTVFCSLGSCFNASLVVWERQRKLSTSVHAITKVDPRRQESTFFSVLDVLCHNGDSIVLVYVIALTGHPWHLLFLSCFYINGLWITRLVVNFRALVLRPASDEDIQRSGNR